MLKPKRGWCLLHPSATSLAPSYHFPGWGKVRCYSVRMHPLVRGGVPIIHTAICLLVFLASMSNYTLSSHLSKYTFPKKIIGVACPLYFVTLIASTPFLYHWFLILFSRACASDLSRVPSFISWTPHSSPLLFLTLTVSFVQQTELDALRNST